MKMNKLKHYSQCALVTLLTGLVFIGIGKLAIISMEGSAKPYVQVGNMLYPNLGEGAKFCDGGMFRDTNGNVILNKNGDVQSCRIIRLKDDELVGFYDR